MRVLAALIVVLTFFLTCLATGPILASSACAVNLLEESGTLISHPASRGDCVC